MKQVVYDESGVLSIQQDAEVPQIKPDQILVKTIACGVNRLDLLQRAGRYPPPPGESHILGVEGTRMQTAKEFSTPAYK
eukprot:m.86789 g.86789  ORF g.86789 m.86789 type:complete len:79 (+) comp36512_c1_seq7:39-275(+)